MPKMTQRLPAPLSERIATATQNIYSRQGREVDVAIGGVPFRLATSTELPHTIETIPVRKDQVDTEADPGEQSLAGWWRRAQASWHKGAGHLYQEDTEQAVDSNGFFDSSGVDVFTPGQISLLKEMVAWVSPPAGSASRVRTYLDPPITVGNSFIVNGVLYRTTTPGLAGTSTHAPAGETVVDGLVSGNNFYDITGTTANKLYQGVIGGAATSWPLGDVPSRLMWGKHRLWVIGGRKLWQPDLSLAGGTTQNPIFTHPNQGWTYTCMAEGSSAMLFGGHDGFSSTIQSVTLDTGGGLPTLSGAAVTAALPDGELVQELAVLAGQYVGIGTNRGFRVGVLNEAGSIIYGPLIVEPEGMEACSAITTQGRFFIVAFQTADNDAVAYRVDTGTELDGGVFPYAKDIDCPTSGTITSLAAPKSSQLVATTDTGALWVQSLTDYVASGWLQTGRIRYRTTERKFFRSLAVEIEPLNGSISIDLIREGGSTQAVGNITIQGRTQEEAFLLGGEAMRYGSVKLTLARTADKLLSPVLNSYQVTAYPAVPPQRLITLPLLCFDREQAKSGQWYGGEGFAVDRLTALQAIENEGELVTYQDFTLSSGDGQMVMIERARFVQTSSVSSRNSVTGPGGILVLELRTVDGT